MGNRVPSSEQKVLELNFGKKKPAQKVETSYYPDKSYKVARSNIKCPLRTGV
jgi:hypothetical protein